MSMPFTSTGEIALQDIYYALDIGTRSVTGLLYAWTQDGCNVIAVHNIEHKNRAMQDGQIHDIEEVANVIKAVTSQLEQVTGQRLNRVSVAAAGRALQTVTVQASVPMVTSTFTAADVYNLQLVALQKAQQVLQEGAGKPNTVQHMHCVGYSVRDYFLDNARIGSLVDQRGETAGVSIIATFLPRVVIDSLDQALVKAGLTMNGLTLEPIAALNALIPASMRKLNIALIDIGAGTSDIAITADGTILAYGMVPIAGDEITEALAQAFLLDFPAAERVKRELKLAGKHTFFDILGNKHALSSKKIIAAIQPAIESLAKNVANEILRQNNDKVPAAVMVIGGGAKTPLIEQAIAQALGLTADRVRMRSRDSIQNVHGCEQELAGSEAVTPIGIALASSYSEITPVTVRVKGASTRLFTFHPLTVGDALLEAGIDVRELKPRAGRALVVEVNGEVKSLKGTLGTPGQVLKNGVLVDLSEMLAATDIIDVIPAVHGQDAQGVLGDITGDFAPLTVHINSQEYRFEPVWTINGKIARANTSIHDRDSITYQRRRVLDVVLDYVHHPLEQAIEVAVNNRPVHLVQRLVAIAPHFEPSAMIYDGLNIEVTPLEVLPFTVSDAFSAASVTLRSGLSVTVNGQLLVLQKPSVLNKNGQLCETTDPLFDGDQITYDTALEQKHDSVTMSTVLLLLGDDFMRQASGKAKLVLRKNGMEADFATPIEKEDNLEVFWEEYATGDI